MTYTEWIEEYVARHENRFVRGKCKAATMEMVKVFPELRIVAGFAHAGWGRDQHWWCIDLNDTIVDPTAEQFYGEVQYEAVDLTDPNDVARIPTGICMGCGDDVYGGNLFCNDVCRFATEQYMKEGNHA
jgi:hypothetical protein